MVNEDSEIQMQHDMMKMTKQYASTQLWNDISNNSNENDKIIIINILDFNHFHTQERKREMGLFDDSTNTVLTNKFCIKYFELLKYSYQDLSDNENIWMSFLKKPTIYDKKQEIVFYKVFHILKIIEKDSVFMNAYNNRMNQIQVYRAAIKIQKENVYKEQTLQNQLEEKQKYELKLRKQFEIQRNENEKQLESKIRAIYSEADRISILQCFETFINHKIFVAQTLNSRIDYQTVCNTLKDTQKLYGINCKEQEILECKRDFLSLFKQMKQ
ncbi:Hypothetical_protein [Hexamita inflata]|uniref:Hypothetical_protein n=1 Tax=Hexamita inflata TaxID=28002 RepID=A0AA86V1F6_9EUKA|nr:Hypothetical protein HINF_LOCUS60122 [Hexamita inflata]